MRLLPYRIVCTFFRPRPQERTADGGTNELIIHLVQEETELNPPRPTLTIRPLGPRSFSYESCIHSPRPFAELAHGANRMPDTLSRSPRPGLAGQHEGFTDTGSQVSYIDIGRKTEPA
ncbi:hypothetical protein CSHISOI_04921 [Colletotrichum shisoi]|uniref:Uncharacterized protein n=1 Tax=Colletotrichum shisoi TaxID=2078593 RepID=A0A5Q4BW66_9PEZI|nr:hypothetical protein CSHISOI_04921 [Colletotrichum shisoi]